MIEKTIPTTTHGRYIVMPAAHGAGARLLAGFHGYIEDAETQMERLRAIDGSERWTLVSIQGLHRFYRRRTNDVVAGWMTRQDRELAIADNVAYVAAVVEREAPGGSTVAYAGFSQGVAMAYRAAAASTYPVAGVIAVGGDLPPELDPAQLTRLRRVLLCRGVRDEWYTSALFEQDQRRLRDAGVALTALEFDGTHEWSTHVLRAASPFLNGFA